MKAYNSDDSIMRADWEPVLHDYKNLILETWWYVTPGATAFFLFMIVWAGQLSRTPTGTGADPPVFLYTGQLFTDGQLVYVHFWDIKPPLIHYLTASVFIFTGGQPLQTHLIATGIGAAAMAGSVALVATIIDRQTGNPIAGAAAAFSILLFPSYYTVAAMGIRPKYLFIFFGLLSIRLLFEDRYLLAGVAAALSAASYQLGAIFIPIVVWQAYRNESSVVKPTAAIASIALFTLAPFIIAGEIFTVIGQTIIIPLIENSHPDATALSRLDVIQSLLPQGGLISGIGAAAAVYEWYRDRSVWWLPIVVGGFLVSLLFLDLNGHPDLIPITAFAAIGVGFAINRLEVVEIDYEYGTMRGHTAALIAVVGLLYLATPSIGGLLMASNLDTSPVGELFFNQKTATSCHVRMSSVESWWTETAGIDTARSWCRWSAGDLLAALRS